MLTGEHIFWGTLVLTIALLVCGSIAFNVQRDTEVSLEAIRHGYSQDVLPGSSYKAWVAPDCECGEKP